MKLKLVVATLLASLLVISVAQARGPYGSINVGNWKGGAYTNDQTGAQRAPDTTAASISWSQSTRPPDGRWASTIPNGR